VKSKPRVPLSAFTIEALHCHRKRMLAEGNFRPDGFVFCTPNGKPWLRSSLHRTSFKPQLHRAGLPSIRFYDLRHGSATLLLLAGEPAKVASERLGHSTIVLTIDT
jgi:integrase